MNGATETCRQMAVQQPALLSLYAANFGPLWTAAHDHIDPYYNNIPADHLKLSVGATAQF